MKIKLLNMNSLQSDTRMIILFVPYLYKQIIYLKVLSIIDDVVTLFDITKYPCGILYIYYKLVT